MDYLEMHELYHHGIAGQKWGVQNGPPYPLDDEDHSSAEKKRAYRDKEYAKEHRLGKYKQKQMVQTAKYYDRQIKSDEKAVKKLSDKYQKLKDKGASDKKMDKLNAKIEKRDVELKTKEFLKDMELKKVSEMSYEQMSKEKKAVAGAFVASFALTVATAAGLPFMMVLAPNTQAIRSNKRIGKDDIFEAGYKAEKVAELNSASRRSGNSVEKVKLLREASDIQKMSDYAYYDGNKKEALRLNSEYEKLMDKANKMK